MLVENDTNPLVGAFELNFALLPHGASWLTTQPVYVIMLPLASSEGWGEQGRSCRGLLRTYFISDPSTSTMKELHQKTAVADCLVLST